MNWKRYLTGALIVWVFIFLYEYILHGVILSGTYQQIVHLLRPEEDMASFFGLVLAGELILAFGFCFIFIKGREGSGLMEGLRYGLVVGLTFGAGSVLIDHAVFPYPESMTFGLIAGYVVEMILAGLIFAGIYRPKSA